MKMTAAIKCVMDRAKLFHSRIVCSNNLMQISMADLLKKLSLKHCNIANVYDPDIALSNVLGTHCNTDKLRKELKIHHYEKEKIYQNQNVLQFLRKLQIDSMDVPLLYKLITRIKAFPTYLKRQNNLCQRPSTSISCCGQCSHLCNLCNKEDCLPNCQNEINNVWDHPCQNCRKTKSECIEANCNICVNRTSDVQCGVSNLTEGVGTSKKNRNTSFHLTLFECQNFILQQTTLKGFPQYNTEKELFQLIRKSFASILNFLSNRDYFQKDALRFEDRHKRIENMNIILFGKAGEISRDVVNNLSRQCLFLTEHIQKIQSELSILHGEEECNKVRLLLLTYSQNDCQLMLKGINVTRISKVKIRQRSDGKILSVDPDEYNFKYDDVEKVSVIKIFHQIEEGSKYDYEVIIEDEQKNNWKASVEQLDPFNDDHVEVKNASTNNELIKVACNESNIDNELSIAEKISLGFKASFNAEEGDCIEAVQYKKHSSISWNKPDVPSICQPNGNKRLLEFHSPSSGIYKFRILIKSSRNVYRFITLDEIEIVDENSLQHTSSCSQTVLMFHPYGECNDVHRELKVLPRQKANAENGMLVAIRLSAGGVAIRDIDELDNYIEQNFWNQNLFSFPPLYMISMDCSYYQIVEKFDTYYRNSKNSKAIILSGADLRDNLLTLGYTDEDIDKLCSDSRRTENIFVFDGNQNTVFVIDICEKEEANAETLKYHHRQCNNSARLFLTINQHIIGGHHMAIVGIVACLNGNREDTKRMVDCEECFQQTLTIDDLQSPESFSGWFDQLNLKVKKHFKPHLGKGVSNDFVFKDIPNRLLLLSAIKNFSLPATSIGTDEEMISRLVLNYSQIHAVYDKENQKKVIKGGYGSGKSLVLKKSLEILVTAGIPTIVYYILFDPYSMVNMDIFNYVLSISTLAKVYVKNVYQLSDEANAKDIFMLSECLQYIRKLHPNETTHVLVDEYDEEELTQIQAFHINHLLSSENFKNAIVVISAQSVEKHRTKFGKNQMPIGNSPAVNWKIAGMKLHNLSHIMRSTNKISDLVETFQDGVAMEKNIIYFPAEKYVIDLLVEESSKRRLPIFSKLSSLFSFRKDHIQSNYSTTASLVAAPSISQDLIEEFEDLTKDFEDLTAQTPTFSDNKLQVEASIDTIAAISTMSSRHSSRIQRSFTFIPSKPGHRIIGSLPKLLRFEHTNKIDISIVQYYIQSYCFDEDHQRKALFICNKINFMQSFVEIFKLISIGAYGYFDSILHNQPPTLEKQKTAYDKLMKDVEKNLLVLTDIRGCRGLEYRKVICVVDESNQYERHMLVEGLSRATSQLYILSIGGESNETNISKIIDDLVDKKFVDDVTRHCTEAIADIKDRKFVEIMEYEKQDRSDILKKKYETMTSHSNSILHKEDIARDWSFEDFDALIKNEKYTKVLQLISMKPSLLYLRGSVTGYRRNNYNLLHSASLHGSNVEFVLRLINAGCGLKEKNSAGSMPIHLAALSNHLDIVKVMLNSEPSLINEKRDSVGLTSLHFAARNNHKDVVEFLLTQPNIDVNVKDNKGRMSHEFNQTNDEIKAMIKHHRQ